MAFTPISGILDSVQGVIAAIDTLFTSDEERSAHETERLRAKVLTQLRALDVAARQIEVNAAQAKHPSVFVAGARPAILWIFALGLGYQFLLYPLFEWAYHLWSIGRGWDAARIAAHKPPRLDYGELIPLVGGILGMAGWRSWEKRAGVARENLRATPRN